MKRYSAFAIAREAARFHTGWERAWASPDPKKNYDVVIVGAGGHGLATAYYLGKNHGITNIAVIEKGWLGGGNTGRNTTIIRSLSIRRYLGRRRFRSVCKRDNQNDACTGTLLVRPQYDYSYSTTSTCVRS